MEEEDQDHDDILQEQTNVISIGDRSYEVNLILRRNYEYKSISHVDVKMKQDGEVVGYLHGYLLTRPSGAFYECADSISGELQELAVIFCDPRGIASRLNHPQLKQNSPCVSSGGFYHIDLVEVKPKHRGYDLGLRIIHESLWFLKNKWSLAVMHPGALSNHVSEWPTDGIHDPFSEPTPEQLEADSLATRKISLHFARMGFTQAGRSPRLSSSWFMTSEFYFPSDIADPKDAAIKRWIPKTEVIDAYFPPKKVKPSGLDKELIDAIQSACECSNVVGLGSMMPPLLDAITKIQRLVQQGASLQRTHALHFAAANSRGDEAKVLEALIRLAGGEVDIRDEDGNTPLHVAAGVMAHVAVSMLVSAGANREARNLEGDTPQDSFLKKLQNDDDFAICFSLQRKPPRAIDILPKMACAKALMTPEAQSLLIDGWMSPRMRELILTTAVIDSDSIMMQYDQFEEAPPLDFIPRLDYIPSAILETVRQGNEKLLRKFIDGWRAIFCCVADLLRRGMTPTCNHIKASFARQVNINYQFYISKGGKIEYALDAILNVTENVYKDGDDGYEYATFEDDIEALPSTPLDWQFDIARFMCIETGGGELTTRGPYRSYYDNFEADDDDDNNMDGDY